MDSQLKKVKAINAETFLFILIFGIIMYFMGHTMGVDKMFSSMMKTAHDLLLNTVFYIMAVAVLAGAIGNLFSEFGVIALINKLLSPLMKPLYGLPGAASLGILTTYLSDNPAIIALANDKEFHKYFKKYQIPSLCNLGTAYGMGLIVTTFMIGKGYILPALIGNIGAIIGSIVSVRLMLYFTKRVIGDEPDKTIENADILNYRYIRNGNGMLRFLDAVLEGGKNGVEIGLAIIPGVLFISTFILMFTFGPGPQGYTGAAYQGIEILPLLGQKLAFIIEPLFGFTSPKAIAFPLTSLGAVGAALGLVPKFIQEGIISGNDIAVFTAMGMCWSGYLSTHVGMMDALKSRFLIGKAILSHTIGGIFAGISAHWIYVLMSMIIK